MTTEPEGKEQEDLVDGNATDEGVDSTIQIDSSKRPIDPELPQAIGKYEVRELLGKGGQACVFLAFDPDLQRLVVIKLYHEFDSEVDRQRVLAEGRHLVRIDSPYVAKCYGADRHQDQPYLILEYIRGDTLDVRCKNESISPDEALELTRQVLTGLSAIHATGLIHRDIKPSNIIVGDDKRARIADFGLAASVASSALAETSGTLAFMAPEQARGDVEQVDQRADLFAVGGVLYFLLTKRPPYKADRFSDLLEMAKRGKVSDVGKLKPELLESIRVFCMRCLETSPSNRYASAAEARQEVDLIIASRRPSDARPVWLIAIPILLLVSGLVTGVVLLRSFDGESTDSNPGGSLSSSDDDSTTRSSDDPAEEQPSTPNVDPTSQYEFASLHPDGRELRKDFELDVRVVEQTRAEDGWVRMNIGEEIAVEVVSASDCFIYVWVVQPEAALQVFPNLAESNQRLEAGESRRIPGEPDVPGQSAQELVSDSSSSGLEYLHVIATDEPIPGLAGNPFGPYSLMLGESELNQLAGRLRDFTLRDRTDQPEAGESKIAEVIIPLLVKGE